LKTSLLVWQQTEAVHNLLVTANLASFEPISP
jgi:hypothetical protein